MEGGFLVMTVTADDYVWNGSQTNWGDADAWTMGGAAATWADGNNAIFNTANATATLAADAAASKVEFTATATVGGSATLTVPEVAVAPAVAATISAPTAGSLMKTGAGILALGSSRADQTTLAEGTLAFASGATVDATKLTLGTDPTKPVTFDYGAQTLTADPKTYIGAGTDVTLTNGVFTYANSQDFNYAAIPSVLTVAKGATFQTDDRFNWNTLGSATIAIVGGTMQSIKNANNWMMQASQTGRLDINVTDGGLLEFGGETYMLTCRDAPNTYQSPELHLKVVDSTLSVKNGRSIRFGRDDTTKNSATPVFTLAATNAVFDIGYGLYLGNDLAGLPTAGSYTADFDSCVITAYQFCVYSDRTLNNATLNGTRIVFNKASSFIQTDDGDAKWMTVGPDGLVIDSRTFAGSLRANLGGTGKITKVGSGVLTIMKDQTSTAALDVDEGAVALNGGLTFNRATTVKNGTTFTVNATARSTVADITFEDGTTLNIASFTPGSCMEVTSLALPASGTVVLTYNGAAFKKGVYDILSKTGLTVADVANLVPSTGGLPYAWSVVDGTLVLNVDGVDGNAWTGLGGDRKMSTGANWLTGVAPVAGDTLDFSSLAAPVTVIADMGETVFNTVNLGSVKKGVTIDGTLHLSTLTVDANEVNLSVAENSKLIVDGDVTLTQTSGTTSKIYMVYENRGEVEVRGRVISDGIANPYPCYDCSSNARFSAKGLYSNSSGDHFKLNAGKSEAPMVNWTIGSAGLTDNRTKTFWIERIDGNTESTHSASLKAAADFTIDATVAIRKQFDLDTDAGYTITVNGPLYNVAGSNSANPMTVSGSGRVVCNYTPTASNPYNGAVTVTNTATVAINSGKTMTKGVITVATNATLEVAQSGVVTLAGDLALADGAVLGFNFTDKTTPTLDVTGRTVTFGSESNVVVKVSAAEGKRAQGGANVLTAGGKFAGATVTLADGAPTWVKDVSVNEDGNIVLEAIPSGCILIVR